MAHARDRCISDILSTMADNIPDSIYDDVDALKRSINGDKLALKKREEQVATCNRYVTAGNATTESIANMKRAMQKFEDKLDVIFAKLQRILELDDTNDGDLVSQTEASMDSLSDRLIDLQKLVDVTLRVWNQKNMDPAPPHPGNQDGAQAKAKAKTELKPEMLTEDFTPAEYNMWKDQYILLSLIHI